MASVSMDFDLELYCEDCDEELNVTQITGNRSTSIGKIVVERCKCEDKE